MTELRQRMIEDMRLVGLSDGFHKVRHYGLWVPANRKHLQRLREEISKHEQSGSREPSESFEHTESLPTDRHDDDQENPSRSEPLRCPQCHEGRLHWVARIPPAARDLTDGHDHIFHQPSMLPRLKLVPRAAAPRHPAGRTHPASLSTLEGS